MDTTPEGWHGIESTAGRKRSAERTLRYQRTSDGVATGGRPKLNESQVAEIRRLSSQFKTNHEIAERFGINYQMVGKVLRGEYKPRPDEVPAPTAGEAGPGMVRASEGQVGGGSSADPSPTDPPPKAAA